MDVYKITKESLLKEIETANSRYAKKASPDAPVAAAPEETQEVWGLPVELYIFDGICLIV